MPGAVKTPIYLNPPPNIFLNFFAYLIKLYVPHINPPIGQHKPLLKQKEIESTYFAISFTSTFKTLFFILYNILQVAALNILAPSICIGKLYLSANFLKSYKY